MMSSFSSLRTLAALGAAALAFTYVAEPVQLHAERVALFKNGYSQVSLVGELPAADKIELKGLPVPLEGSLWWELPQGVKLIQVEGSVQERDVPSAEYTLPELLAANIGKHVRIETGSEFSSHTYYFGEITSQPLPAAEAHTYTNRDESKLQAPIFLKSADGKLWEINLRNVLSISFDEPPSTPAAKELRPLLTMQLSAPAAGKLHLECLAQGLSWNPSYHLNLTEEGQATLSCMAIITNDMVDLEHTHLELNTGNPLLGYENLTISPLTRLDSLDSAPLRRKASSRSNAMVTPAPCVMEVSEDIDAEAVPAVTRTLELYQHSIPDFSARKNSTVARELFSQTPACTHIYSCTISSISRRGEPAEVWHDIRLKNEAEWPWGCGTIVCYSGGKLLARTTLQTTAPGDETRLRMSTTHEVKATASEELISNVLHPGDDSHTRLYTYQGVINLQNNAKHPIELELTRTLRGEVSKASDNAELHSTPISNASPHSTITWRLTLAPGETKNCTYTYIHFVQEPSCP